MAKNSNAINYTVTEQQTLYSCINSLNKWAASVNASLSDLQRQIVDLQALAAATATTASPSKPAST